MRKSFIWISTLVFSLAIAGQAGAVGLELAVGAWQQSLGGELGYEIDNNGDIIDLDQELDFDDELRVIGRANIDLPLFFPNIYLMASPMEFEGTGSKSVPFSFGDFDFAADADLDVTVTMNQYDIAFYWGIPLLKKATNDVFNIDLGLNVRIIDLEATVSGEEDLTSTIVEENVSATVPLPMLFVALQIEPTDSIAIALEGRAISIGDNKLYSLIGRFRYKFAGPVFAAVGYRFDTLEIDEEDVVADVDFSGPFAELGLIF
jgi:outer membrane protein